MPAKNSSAIGKTISYDTAKITSFSVDLMQLAIFVAYDRLLDVSKTSENVITIENTDFPAAIQRANQNIITVLYAANPGLEAAYPNLAVDVYDGLKRSLYDDVLLNEPDLQSATIS